MSRLVLVERVERKLCDGCGVSIDPDNDPPSRAGGWFWLDIRVIGLPGPGPLLESIGRDACSSSCLARTIDSAAEVFEAYLAGHDVRHEALRDGAR